MKRIGPEIAIKKRYPEGVALVVCRDKKGMVDVTPIGWFMMCNSDPKCWAISLYKKHYSHKVISETNEFCLCLPSFKQKEDTLYCGSVSGWNTDKLKGCDLKTIPSQKVKPPILKDCIACFECQVIGKLPAPDHTTFIGEVLVAYISERKSKVYNWGEHDLFELKIK